MRLEFRRFGWGFFVSSMFSLFAMPAGAQAQLVAPAGYEAIPLVDSQGHPFAPNGLAVSSSGEMVALSTNSSTGNTVVTLYNTWQNGRSVVGTATNSKWTFDTDPVFLNSTTILFGDNTSSSTDALWEVNFSNPSSPTETQITVNGSLPNVQGVVPVNATAALVSGQAAGSSGGGLYLDSVDLTKTSNNITTLQSGIGTGFPGAAGISPGGSDLLLEDLLSGSGLIHVFPKSGSPSTISLTGGATGIAFDSAGDAFVTTGTTVSEVTGIDSASPVVSQFASNPASGAFLTSISFTGGAFNPGEVGDTGALIVNDAGFGGNDVPQAYAIVVPEPGSLALLAAIGVFGLARNRRVVR